ncbi:Maltodextrin phosphorylase [Nitrospira tepida]|uniref:Maltodextrin phosphorylase n=1 Tax=Nitrospira tepida TaxID=2973512 RepID=A0AA86MYD8_9BACT|nr:alpha-glucan family phosphorylase [Nitrospira tepida]CAI4031208.1 Maltodextrin phosphorylase [Nitrospira tepida]
MSAHRLPHPIARLHDLAQNPWWSWRLDARRLFEAIDPVLWFHCHHNPVLLLQSVNPERLTALATDPGFARQYSAVIKAFDEYRSDRRTWFATRYATLTNFQVAYMSAEFGFHNSIPIYSGGLGILAGDHCKEASDLGLPLIGLGFMYPQGYFRQSITPDGWQEAEYAPFNRDESPINPALTPEGTPCHISVEMGGRQVSATIWKVQIGRIPIYLLDTDVPNNAPEDRGLSARLYGGGQEMRLCQEILLGLGGVRALRALGLNPTVWHANEGHSAFLTLERLREHVRAGLTHSEAVEAVRHSTVFTTHTPVPAGHDVFPLDLMERYFNGYWDQLGLTRSAFFRLGEHPDHPGAGFNMTALAMRLSAHVNGVSREHGRVTRQMWQSLWPGLSEDLIPIRSITNGVHVPTWIAPELHQLYSKYLSPDWVDRSDDPAIWQRVPDIPDADLWAVRQLMKRKLMSFIRERARGGWAEGRLLASQVLSRGTMLDPEALTIGFARRFATYKRATLLFRDLERLRRLLHDRWRPVQIVFAGKAHPADEPGRQFIHQVLSYCHDHKLAGHIAFLENYDMHMAKYLVQGVDVWLNTPRAPMEASGTSGQKATLNGVLHLSVLDGWWQEGYDGSNGWGIPPSSHLQDPAAEDDLDSKELYRLLEEEVIPLYYQRDLDGVPRAWLQVVKQSIRTNAPRFSARRMVKEYMDLVYAPASTKAPSSW